MGKSLYDYCIETDRLALLDQWDIALNEGLTPQMVSYGSPQKAWWRCELGHCYEAEVYARAIRDTGCPYCDGKKVLAGFNDLAGKFPEIASQWHPSKNEGLLPEEVTAFSSKKVWWICPKGHDYFAMIRNRTREKSGCPYCEGRKVLAGFNDLATVNPDIAAQWHPTLNDGLAPHMVSYGSTAKAWWRCEKGHVWKVAIHSRTRQKETGCPVCSGKVISPGENDLAALNPEIAAQWHPILNGALTPEMVTVGSARNVWWRCEHGHEYQARIADRVSRTYNCPYCSGKRILAGFNDLATKSPDVAAQWHPILNGDLTPEMVTYCTTKKVWWQCEHGHEWQAKVYTRAKGQKSGCPVCYHQSRRKTVETP
ncbi:MAG: zinc-ribbon domain-containing protein [Oscillospiraceae bacterium]|nr:zinc-ribbon domain-containing protein [Oscillospiraceae bacterium]